MFLCFRGGPKEPVFFLSVKRGGGGLGQANKSLSENTSKIFLTNWVSTILDEKLSFFWPFSSWRVLLNPKKSLSEKTFWGVPKWHLGCPNQNSKITFQYKQKGTGAEWKKVWSRLSAHLQPFFRLLARILRIFDEKYHILTCRHKRESYLIVLHQSNA